MRLVGIILLVVMVLGLGVVVLVGRYGGETRADLQRGTRDIAPIPR